MFLNGTIIYCFPKIGRGTIIYCFPKIGRGSFVASEGWRYNIMSQESRTKGTYYIIGTFAIVRKVRWNARTKGCEKVRGVIK
jgi:hypothetical protein